jgi:predicted site-specific integrase-resolvase
MDNENYISPNKITKQYDITSGTLRRWAEAGKIRCLRPNGGKRIYNIEDIKKIFNKNKTQENTQDTNEEKKDNLNQEQNHQDQDIQNVLQKLKQNIQENTGDISINHIENELNDIMVLINHMKTKEN